jgi:hypothetical protein
LNPLLLASFEAFFCFNLLFLLEEKQVGIITRNKLYLLASFFLCLIWKKTMNQLFTNLTVQILVLRAFYINPMPHTLVSQYKN